MLSPEIDGQLKQAYERQSDYRPNEAICQQLGEKSLLMFAGPVATGKSFLMNHIAEKNDDFSRVPVFTTRNPRPDDEPGMFRYVPHDDEHVAALLGKIERGEVVQYAVHPTSRRLYGSEPHDHSNRFNMLAMLTGGISQLRELPFASTHVIGVATSPDVWSDRLHQRYPHDSADRTARLKEARLSLEWLLAHGESVHWVDNTPSGAEEAAQEVVVAIKNGADSDTTIAKENAQAMLAVVQRG